MPVKFVFLLLPGLHLMDLAGPDQTIHEAMDYGADFEIAYCSVDADITSSAGLGIGRHQHFSEIDQDSIDYLIIPGTRVSDLSPHAFKEHTALLDWIRDCHRRQVKLVSICSGAFVLAQCGLLDGLSCTTHFKQTKRLQERYPKVLVKENMLFVEERNIYTSAGIASGIDLMLHIVEQLKGSYFAHKVARELVIYNRRDGHQEQLSAFMQFRNHVHSGIHNSQDFIVEHIEKKHHLVALAEVANMSERNFTRTFKKETGITVIAYINSIRKEIIEKLLQHKDLNYVQIARKVGLESEKQVRRLLHS
jgi:transcriptional regulator GlxA family with amidase domain